MTYMVLKAAAATTWSWERRLFLAFYAFRENGDLGGPWAYISEPLDSGT